MALKKQRMSAIDAAWLRMDRPTNLMMIVGVIIFREKVDYRRFRRVIEQRFLKFARFRCLPEQDALGASWVPDRDFELDAHIRRVALPGKAGQAELEALVSHLAGTDLDRRRPLWQFHFVENFTEGSAIIMRIHHCYADGTAMVRVFLTLTDLEANPAVARSKASPAASKSAPAGEDASAWLGRLGVPGMAIVQKVLEGGVEWVGRAADMTRNPEQATELARHALGIAAEMARVATLPDDPPSRFKGELGARKIAAWSSPLPLAEVKTVARALGCTVNDVLMTAAAGALGDYLRDHGDDTTSLTIRAAVPVNLRDPGEAAALGNYFGLVFLELPVGIVNPLERLYAVHQAMAALKNSYQPVLTLGLMAALGMMPEAVESAAIDILSTKATAVATNVPGPTHPMYLAGSEISRLIFWVPQSGDIGLGISILSYNGQVQFGLISDHKRVPDPAAVAGRFRAEFEKILMSLLLGPYLVERS